jgi:hypothetical protein
MTNILETELIHSLPKLVHQAIITVYCPQKYDKMAVLKDPENLNVWLGSTLVSAVRADLRQGSSAFEALNLTSRLSIIVELGGSPTKITDLVPLITNCLIVSIGPSWNCWIFRLLCAPRLYHVYSNVW